MGSNHAEHAALAERCRRIGWDVTRNRSGGWRVRDANGRIHVISGTVNSQGAVKSTLQELTRAGLLEAEEKIIAEKEAERRRGLAEGRTDEAQRIAAGTDTPTTITTTVPGARLDGEPEDCDLDWLTTPQDRPWFRWMHITADAAEYLLEVHNSDNRSIGYTTIEQYREIILAGDWALTHQGVAIDTRGVIQDAQHRFRALVEAHAVDPEITQLPFAVFCGMPEANFAMLDEGRRRTAAQLIARDGTEKYVNHKQTAVRLVHCYDAPDPRAADHKALTNQTILRAYYADAQAYRAGADIGSHGATLHTSGGALMAAHYLLHRENGADNRYVDAFFDGLLRGMYPDTRVALDDDDPRQTYRNRMEEISKKSRGKTGRLRKASGQYRSPLSQLGMLITSWNNCVLDRHPAFLVFADDAPIPKILRCTPGVGDIPYAFKDRT